MMSALGLDAEETSLDHMLRDLGFGDGTPASRQSALQKATDQYELDVSSGLLTNLMRGRLVQLLLVQVQQLKVGLLSALDTIDVLLQGNRINFQVLAAIPAIVIATYGTRYFLRGLYNIRAKDIRPVTVVHGEMTRYLTKMENIFLLSDSVTAQENDRRGEIPLRWATQLGPAELGELILNMHRYLILLDFSSPPFRPRDCDDIQQAMQRFFGTTGTLKRLGHDRQLEWLGRIKQKHQDLVKTL
jgi:nuclear-control-of-ATPase protein 2